MSDFGFWELSLVALIALLVVGPERLPQLAKTAGYWIGRIKRMSMVFKSEFMHEADKMGANKILDETRDIAKEVKKEVGQLDPLTKAMDEQIASGRFTPDNKVESDDQEGSDTPQTAATDKPRQE